MSTATAVLDTERLVAELRDDGVPEVKAYAIARLLADVQAYALARLLADVRYPGFDHEIAHQDLVMVGFTSARADELIKGAVRGSAGPPSRSWWHR